MADDEGKPSVEKITEEEEDKENMDEEKTEMDRKKVCPNIKLYGECSSVSESKEDSRCPFRHYFLADELNKRPVVPRSCELEMQITRCINPSQYIGHIRGFRELEELSDKRKPRVSYANRLEERMNEVKAFYEITENRIPLESYESGDLCVVKVPNLECYARAVIDEVLTKKSPDLPAAIQVYCLDIGEHFECQAEDLLVMCDDMVEVEDLAVVINLANLKPPKGGYTPRHIQEASSLTVGKNFFGRVQLATETDVWIYPLLEVKIPRLPEEGGLKSVDFQKWTSVRLELKRLQLAEENDDHLLKIKELWKETGFLCPELLSPRCRSGENLPRFFQLGDEIQWAFLPMHESVLQEMVTFIPLYHKNPHLICGVLETFVDQRRNLDLDIRRYVEEMLSECPNYAVRFSRMYEPNLMVAALDPTDSVWRRAIIKSVTYRRDGRTLFDVYFTEIGERCNNFTSEELLPIPLNLVTRLPCQAIFLKLAHIRPKSSDAMDVGWSNDAKEALDLYLTDEENRPINVDVWVREPIVHTFLNIRYYEAAAFQSDGQELGESLVARNVAEYVEGEEDFVASIRRDIVNLVDLVFRSASSDNKRVFNISPIENPSQSYTFTEDQLLEFIDYSPDGTGPGGRSLRGCLSVADEEIETINISGPSVTVNSASAEGLLHPVVFWKQTKSSLLLKIQLPGVKEYDLKVNEKKVFFQSLRPAGYGFELELWGRVHSPEVEVMGICSRITLEKEVKSLWPKVLACKSPVPWLKLDTEDSEDDEQGNA